MYKGLLILGNGFDLSLGLNTSYDSFWEDSKDKIMERAPLMGGRIKAQKAKNNWVDLEMAIKETLENCSDIEMSTNAPRFIGELSQIKLLLEDFISQSIEGYGQVMSTDSFGMLSKLAKTHSIFSFNYTPIDKLLWVENGTAFDELATHDFTHIHNKLNNDIILGVGSYRFQDKYPEFTKAFQDPNIKKFKEELNDSDEIIFFGHSLGETDFFYFKDFLNTVKGRRLVFITKDRDSWDNIKRNIFSNEIDYTELRANNTIETYYTAPESYTDKSAATKFKSEISED